MDSSYTYAISAYKDPKFMNGDSARHIRILCELEGSKVRLEQNKVQATVLIFGSARAKSSAQFQAEIADLESRGKTAEVEKMKSKEWMCEYYDKVEQIAKHITKWACSNVALQNVRTINGVSRSKSVEALNGIDIDEDNASNMTDGDTRSSNGLSSPISSSEISSDIVQKVVVCTGGGPGFMEAANKGAASVSGARTMGMGITLPFEAGLNQYVTDELAFQYHYFFTRKFWMVYHCQALIAAPGGVGTFDELFEVLTLKQTGKIHKDLPVVLMGKTFWTTVVNWQALVDYGVISESDVKNLFFTDSVDEACNYIIETLTGSKKE